MLYRNKLLFICLSLLSFISVQAMEITTLHEAINQGNLERVVQLLNNGHRNRINELCQDGTFKGLSPLHIAASKGQLPIIAALIAENANPNLFDQETGVRDHKTPLHIAIEKGNPTIVRYLLEHTANLEIPTKRGTSAIIFNVYPIHQAAQIGSVEIVRYMLDKHASVMHKDSTDNYPLHYAVRHNNVELVKALIDVPNETFYQTSGTYGFFVVSPTYWKGISKKIQNRINYINSRNSVGLSPLDIASYEGNVDVVRYLIDNQATSLDTALTHAIKGFDIRTQENEETRYEKTKAIICALIKAGAHISENPNILKLAILHGATEKLVRLLLSLGASTGIIHPGENYWIDHPLHEAADAGNLDRVRTLLHAPGFHANLRDITQETPLHKAAAQGHTQIIEYLINEGAIIDIQNATGKTPLHIAASKGFIAAAQALLKHGANIRQETPEHITPLIIAIQNNQTEMAKFLINHGACIYQKNPIHKAIETGNVTLINKILEKHAIITPHMIELARNSHPEIAQLLRERLSTMEHTFKLHQLPSLQEDEMVHNRAEGECWQLIPSLQQARPDGKLTQMCGYYALYNAVCFTRSREADMLHRATFSQFLNEALKDIYALRSFNPLDNLTTQDLQYIIQMHYENLPIIVIEKKSLFIYLNKIVADINQALEVTPNKNFLRDFIEKKINKLSIIAGTGDSSGHWFTLYAERRQDDKIILKISDSAYKIANWNLKRFEHDVLPFYLAISNPLESWPQIFNKTVLDELFSEYQDDVTNELTRDAQDLQLLIKSIRNVKDSLIIYLEAGMPEKISEIQQIITHIRLNKFTETVRIILPRILAQAVKINPQDSLGNRFIFLYTLLQKNMQDLCVALTKINEDIACSVAKRQQVSSIPANEQTIIRLNIEEKEKRQKAVLFLAATLNKLEKSASSLLKLIIKNPAANGTSEQTTDDSFINNPKELSQEFLQLILKFLPDAVKGIIGQISQDNHDPIRVLFVGAPGNGKTTIAQAIAQICHRPFCFIPVAALGNSYQFSRENQIKALEDYMKKNPTAIILLDEIDSIRELPTQPERTAERLQGIIDLAKKEYPRAIFIATTNYKDKIPDPLLSRFKQNILTIENPTENQRGYIILYHIRRLENTGLQFRLDTTYLQTLIGNTKHFSIRDLESLFENIQGRAHLEAGERVIQQATPDVPASSEAATSLASSVVTPNTVELAYKTVLAELITPDSRIERFGKATLELANTLAPFVPYGNLALSVYSTYKAVRNRREDIAREGQIIDAANKRQDRLIREANERQDKQRKDDQDFSLALHHESQRQSGHQFDLSHTLNKIQLQLSQQAASQRNVEAMMQRLSGITEPAAHWVGRQVTQPEYVRR